MAYQRLFPGLLLVIAACGAPSTAADQSAVQAAQAGWCQGLAKASGATAWEPMAACKAATPSASAAYLRGMTKCMAARRESYGDKAPDSGHLVAECNDEVTIKMSFDDASFQEAIDARCERASRCESVPIPDCVAAVKKLESPQRAQLYAMYNAGAVHTLADCLKSSACRADEDRGREACYKPLEDKLLWFP
jgi:hypothetical protein